MDHGTLALLIPIAAIVCGCGIPISAIFLTHLRKIAEIKANSVQGNNAALYAELQSLRDEIERLRDTSTRFDLSFDAGLNRLEERVSRVEGNAVDSVGRSAASQADRPEVLMARSR